MIEYMPPLVIDVHVHEVGGRRVRVWFPFVLLWPFLAIVFGFALLVTALVDLALLGAGARYHHYTQLLLGVLRLLGESRGTRVNALSDNSLIHVTIY